MAGATPDRVLALLTKLEEEVEAMWEVYEQDYQLTKRGDVPKHDAVGLAAVRYHYFNHHRGGVHAAARLVRELLVDAPIDSAHSCGAGYAHSDPLWPERDGQ